ncbi:MAG: flagellar export chaperone FliS [bacterium]|nr:flagellar export chaperone FliS [bacterium]
MDVQAAAQAYRSSSIENAPPIKIVRMLFEGAIRFLDRAAKEDPSDPKSEFVNLLHRTDAIVSELRLAIDHSAETEVTGNLEALYLFCETEIGRASLDRSTEPLVGARDVLVTLLSAWRQVEIDMTRTADGV